MKERIEVVVDPEITSFNVALPSKGRLAIFVEVCPEKKPKRKTNRKTQYASY